MIIVVEGPQRSGQDHLDRRALPAGHGDRRDAWRPAPVRTLDPDGAAARWARISAARWHAARQAEQSTGTAVCDTDPLKLRYVWSLSRAGQPGAANGTPNSTPPASCSSRAASASPTSSSSRSPSRPPWPPAARQIHPPQAELRPPRPARWPAPRLVSRSGATRPPASALGLPPPASQTPPPDPATTAPGPTSSMHLSASSLPG